MQPFGVSFSYEVEQSILRRFTNKHPAMEILLMSMVRLRAI